VTTTIQVITNSPTHIPKGFDQQPPNGRQLGDSPRGISPRADSLGEPPFNPAIGYFGWPSFDPHMFIPPCYQPPIVQLVLEPTTKLPYKKLQYPTHVKNTNLDAHIKIFKKSIKANGEMMEANIVNLFRFTLKDSNFEWGENYVQDHPNYTIEELE
jgi:hypothetical protein